MGKVMKEVVEIESINQLHEMIDGKVFDGQSDFIGFDSIREIVVRFITYLIIETNCDVNPLLKMTKTDKGVVDVCSNIIFTGAGERLAEAQQHKDVTH